MKGYIFITSTGTDPLAGKYLKDPTLDRIPTFGACQPQLRRTLDPDDFLFVISGSIRNKGLSQYIIGGLQVDKKLHATEAHAILPNQRLHLRPDGQVSGNIICNADGAPNELDRHKKFEKRLNNYIIGKNAIALETEEEVARGRDRTMGILRSVFHKDGQIPRDIIGRCSKMDGDQVHEMVHYLRQLKSS